MHFFNCKKAFLSSVPIPHFFAKFVFAIVLKFMIFVVLKAKSLEHNFCCFSVEETIIGRPNSFTH